MDLRESPATLQSQPPHPPPGMAVGPPNSYSTSLPNATNTATNNNHTHNASSAMITPNSSAAASMMQNPGFPFNPAASKPTDSLNLQYGDGSQQSRAYGFTIEPARKKRGRPRKYSPEGGSIALGLTTSSLNPGPSTPLSSSMVVHGDSNSTPGTTTSESQAKKSRGRPAGSGKKQLDALGSFGVGFTPHVILVEAGEDIASKIKAFSEQGPRTVCILSANGAVCNVALSQPAMSGGTVTYEGRFEIISLSGSFSLSEINGARSRIGCLSVSLAGSDGRVLGGAVSGMLVAATPVQVIVGSFIAEGKKPKSLPSPAQPPSMLNFGTPTTEPSPPSSQVPSSGGESSDDHDNDNGNCSFDGGMSGPPFNNVSQQQQQPFHSGGGGSMPMFTNMGGWPNSSVHMFPK